MFKKLLVFIIVFSFQSIFPCTTAIVSGKFTKNGRPLLLKHRDSGFMQNKLMFFEDGKYDYCDLLLREAENYFRENPRDIPFPTHLDIDLRRIRYYTAGCDEGP